MAPATSQAGSLDAAGTRVVVLAAVGEELRALSELLSRFPAASRPALVVTGAGKVQAALAADAAVRAHAPAWIVQVGCGGALPGGGLDVGDVVIACEEVLADDGVEAPGGFLTLRDIGLPSAVRGDETRYNELPARSPNEAVLARIRGRFEARFRVLTGRLATVSTGSGTDERAELVARRSRCVAESMEGAAAAIAAWNHGVAFSEVRGISNLAGRRDRGAWEIETACRHAAEVLMTWFEIEEAVPCAR